MRKLSIIIVAIWFITLIFALWKFWDTPRKQHRFVSVVGVEIDFSNNKSMSFGGFSNDLETKPEIQLPTKLVPFDFAQLVYRNDELKLQLKNKVSDDYDNTFLETTYPTVYLNDNKDIKYKKGNEIPQKALEEGIVIDYAVKGNIEVRFEKISNRTFRMYLSAGYTHLKFNLPDYYKDEGQQIEFSINDKQSASIPNFDIPLIELDFPNSNPANTILTFKENRIFQNDTIIANSGEIATIHNSNVLIKLNTKTSSYFFFLLFIIVYMIVGVILIFNLLRPTIEETPQSKRAASFDIIFLLVGALFHLSIPLSLHYIYFSPYRPERVTFLFYGIIALTAYPFHLFFYTKIKKYLKNWKKRMSVFSKGTTIILLLAVSLLFIVLFFFSHNERIFGFGTNFFGRIVYIVALIIIGNNKWKYWIKGILMFILMSIYTYTTGDNGFVAVTVFFQILFILVPTSNYENDKYKYIFLISKTALIIIFLFFVYEWLPNFIQKHDFASDKLDRFYLVYDGNQDNIHVDHQLSSVYHDFMLYQSFENLDGKYDDYIIPKSFRNVIHTDYVLLFAFGYYCIFMQIMIIVLLFLIGFFLSRMVLYLYLANKIKLSWLYFIVLSYVAQIFFMYGAILKVFPLTGQSIPFLSLSKTEHILFLFFIFIAVILFKYSTEKTPSEEQENKIRLLSKKLSFYYIFLFVGITLIGFAKLKNKNYSNQNKSIKLSYTSIHTENFNEILSHFKVNKNSTLEGILKNTKISDIEENSKNYDDYKGLLIKFLAEEYLGQNNRFSMSDTTITYKPILYRNANYHKFISNLEYKPFKSKEIAKFDNQGVILEQIGNSLYVNKSIFSDSLANPQFFKLSDENSSNLNRKVLLGNNPQIRTRLVNGEEKVVIYNADILGFQPDINVDILNRFDNPPQISIDPYLQVLLYGLLNNLNSEKFSKIDIKSVVIINNKTGEVKAMMSSPFLKANVTELEKGAYKKSFNKMKFDVSHEYLNIALTGYNVASTFKVFVAGATLLSNRKYENKIYCCNGITKDNSIQYGFTCHSNSHKGNVSLIEFISKSCNHYSAQLLKDVLLNDSLQFLEHLKNDFYISYSYKNFSKPPQYCLQNFEQPTIGVIDSKYLPQTSIGGYNVKIPLVIGTSSFSRVISGIKIFPSIFSHTNYSFEKIQNYSALTNLKVGLKEVIQEGTANNFKKYNNIKYAKTGTGNKKSSFVLFSTDEYTYGIMFLNSGGVKDSTQSAKSFAEHHLIPTIQIINKNYLK